MGKRTLDLNGVHVFRKVPNAQHYALAEVHPAIRVTQGDNSLYIQDGSVFTPGGVLVPAAELPSWFHDEVKKCTPKALADAGYAAPAAPLKSRRAAAAKAPEATAE